MNFRRSTTQTTEADGIITEVRAIRDEYAARFGYDAAAISRDLRARQENSERVYVRYPARRVEAGSDSGATTPVCSAMMP